MTTIGTTDHLRRTTDRELLRYACSRQIFSPYGGGILDVRRAVLIDGTDHTDAKGKPGTMHVMTAAEFDKVIENVGGVEALKAKFGWDFEVYDGRELGFR